MAHSPLGDIEDLTLCSVCKLPFNDGDQLPKLLACKHHFCLKCVTGVLLKGRELYCPYCWKRSDEPRPETLPTYGAVLALAQRLAAPPKPPAPDKHKAHPRQDRDTCHTHAMPTSLWCHSCGLQLCRACAAQPDHLAHTVKPAADARQLLRQDFHSELGLMQKMLSDIQHLAFKQRDFLLKILEACTTLKTQVETDLVNNTPGYELAEARERLQEARHAYGTTEALGPPDIQRLLSSLAGQRERLQAKHREMFLQCKLDDLIKNSGVLFDFELLKRALATIHSGEAGLPTENNGYHNPVLFLANYCMSQLYSRHFLFKQQQTDGRTFPGGQNGDADFRAILPAPPPPPYVPLAMPNSDKNNIRNLTENSLVKGVGGYGSEIQNNLLPNLNISKASPLGYGESGGSLNSPNMSKGPFQTDSLSMGLPSLLPHSPVPLLLPPPLLHHSPQANMVRNPSQHVYPIFYFNIEINGAPFGRILIEVRSDVAPKMAKNFGILTTGELGIGYKGCNIFQCWENESIITGDFELNNGRGGRSIFDESFFMPDDTKILAIRGSVGMRRSQKRHDNLGLVGSQFRIILREMRGFTGIFAFVVEGLELVDRISQSGDSAGKPQSNILIASCGKLN